MYGYAELFELTPEQLLQKVTQEQIFEFILKQPVNLNWRYCSPFRVDNNPGCRFEQRPDGTLVFVDWGERLIVNGKVHRSCFSMVMDSYKVNLTKAMQIICSEFGLSTDKHEYQVVDKVLYDLRQEQDSNKTIMTFEKKQFSKADTLFWSQYLIKPQHLIEDGHSSVRQFTKKNQKGYKIITPYKPCFVFDFIDTMKFYQPYSDKYKWITNCDEDDIGNFDNLPPTGEELIVQKAYKDHRVLRNLDWGLNVVWFQNEGCVPSEDILRNISQRFKLITFFYDNDDDGIVAADKLTNIFNEIREGSSRAIHLPRKRKHKQLFGHYLKDPSDFIQKEGRQDLITVLKQIGINGKNT
jgi:hypothetical protein